MLLAGHGWIGRNPSSVIRTSRETVGVVASGTVTFLFTDIEDSTVLWDRFPVAMNNALGRHDELLRSAFAASQGRVFSTGGDGFAVAFDSAVDAVVGAVRGQQVIQVEGWDRRTMIRVRMGLHTGVVDLRDGNYYGPAVSRAARICAAACGCQVLLSASTNALIADSGLNTVDFGEYELKGFERPERLFCVDAPSLNIVEVPLRFGVPVIGNLPRQRAALVGRESETERLGGLIGCGSLITLVGVGGVGKTRLAVSVACDVTSRFADGVWLVELGEVSDPDAVALAVAAALGLRLGSSADSCAAVATALGRQERLIVLDNCEHVVAACADVVEAIRARCPSVAIVATSRELLGVDDEVSFLVQPLGLDPRETISEAAQLFCERAEGVLGDFEPNANDLEIVEQICRQIDGLPLAIELAAARMSAFGVEQLRDGLNDRFNLLIRPRGAVERQRSLRTTVAWSHDLLSSNEQLLFNRLSIFPGDFDLDAAEAVCGYRPLGARLGGHVASLVDHSMISVVRRSGGTRYQLLETMRQYGQEKLESSQDSIMLAQRYLAYFVAFAAAADAGIRGRNELRWHHRFADEWNNLGYALGSAVTSDDGGSACGLIWHCHRWASTRLRLEVGDWADRVSELKSVREHPLRPVVLACSAQIAQKKGDFVKARRLARLARDEESRIGEAVEPWVPDVFGLVYLADGHSAAQDSADAIRRRAPDDPFWRAMALRRETMITWHLLTSDQLSDEEAQVRLARAREAVDEAESYGNPTLIANVRATLGAALQRLEPEHAVALLEAAIAIATELGAEDLASTAYPDLAYAYASLGRPFDALAILGPAMRHDARTGTWNNFIVTLSGALAPLAQLDRHPIAALGLGYLGRILHSAPMLQKSLTPPELENELSAELGNAELHRLRSEGAALTAADLSDIVLETITDLLTEPYLPPAGERQA